MNFLNLGISSNARTNWLTIIFAGVLGILGFFKLVPDLETASAVGDTVTNAIGYAKGGSWALLFTAVINLVNTVTHILKDKPTLTDDGE